MQLNYYKKNFQDLFGDKNRLEENLISKQKEVDRLKLEIGEIKLHQYRNTTVQSVANTPTAQFYSRASSNTADMFSETINTSQIPNSQNSFESLVNENCGDSNFPTSIIDMSHDLY